MHKYKAFIMLLGHGALCSCAPAPGIGSDAFWTYCSLPFAQERKASGAWETQAPEGWYTNCRCVTLVRPMKCVFDESQSPVPENAQTSEA